MDLAHTLNEGISSERINIRPAVSVYATYRRLSYTPWYAIAEFVDNSTQNYYDHRADLLGAYRTERNPGRLRVEISYDSERNTLTVSDNANGMDIEEVTRAVVLDKPPPNTSGRCEYGMGLKTAACWFGKRWTIQTTRLGNPKEYTVAIDVTELVQRRSEEIIVDTRPADPRKHYTIITIEGLYKPIRGRTVGRIRDQLGSMYREDLRRGEVEIIWNGEPVRFEEPPILVEDLGATSVEWKKQIAFEVPWDVEGTVLHVRGWVGIRSRGSQRDAGFALLRRGRVIVGGPGAGYKPTEIFGQGNTFRSQRLIGELHMDDWPVTQAKDAFDWSGGLEDAFIERLRSACQDYMDKAEGYRQPGRRVSVADFQLASEATKRAVGSDRFAAMVATELTLPEPGKSTEDEQKDRTKLHAVSQGPMVYTVPVPVGESPWLFRLHWQDQISDAHWMSVSYPQDTVTDIFLNMAHPFFVEYLDNRGFLEVLQKFVLALALAERLARITSSNGLISPGDFRNHMNRVLRYVAKAQEEASEFDRDRSDR